MDDSAPSPNSDDDSRKEKATKKPSKTDRVKEKKRKMKQANREGDIPEIEKQQLFTGTIRSFSSTDELNQEEYLNSLLGDIGSGNGSKPNSRNGSREAITAFASVVEIFNTLAAFMVRHPEITIVVGVLLLFNSLRETL